MKSKQNSSQKGFSMIELLVVIAMIGLLASIILVVLSNARQKGRDARRVGDMRQMNTAMELFYNTNKGYPSANSGVPLNLTTTYISTIPTAPVPADGVCATTTNPPGSAANTYYYVPTGTSSVVNGLTVWSDYNYYFCISTQVGNYAAGTRTLTPKGIR